ncbi:MAG TPA: YceI family protein [Caulobacteraceae bacterium]|jgi:polyisoprenoid-binding protein YceI|nr:YceI family protein [Caulobacteraceae bacterium]
MSLPMPRLFPAHILPGMAAGLILSGAALAAAVAPQALAEAGAGVSRDPATAPAGVYKLDPRHSSVVARVQHMGFSHFAIRFNAESGTLDWDPADPTRSKLDVTVDPKTIHTGVDSLDKEVLGGLFTDEPPVRFVSTHIERTGPTTGRITGNLTYHGVTKPVTLETVFDGAGKSFGHVRMAFSAKGAFSQRAFGADKFTQFVSDEATLEIETEFSK